MAIPSSVNGIVMLKGNDQVSADDGLSDTSFPTNCATPAIVLKITCIKMPGHKLRVR